MRISDWSSDVCSSDLLAEAQRLGYAEADPSFDVDGIDTAHKLAILTALAFGCEVDFGSVYVEGIRNVSALDVAYADELGYRIRSEERRGGKECVSTCRSRWPAYP